MYGDDEALLRRSGSINPARHRMTPTANVEGLEKRRMTTFNSADDSDSGTSYSSRSIVSGKYRAPRPTLQSKQMSPEEREKAIAAQRFPVSRMTPAINVPVPQPPPMAKIGPPTFRKPQVSSIQNRFIHQRPTSLNLSPQQSATSTTPSPQSSNASSSTRASMLLIANPIQSRMGARVQLNPYGEVIYASPPSSSLSADSVQRPLPMRPSPLGMANPLQQMTSPASIASSYSSYSSPNGNHPHFITSPGSLSHPSAIYNHNYSLNNEHIRHNAPRNSLTLISSPLSPSIYGTRPQGKFYPRLLINSLTNRCIFL